MLKNNGRKISRDEMQVIMKEQRDQMRYNKKHGYRDSVWREEAFLDTVREARRGW